MNDSATGSSLQHDIERFSEYLRGLNPDRLSMNDLSPVYMPDAVWPLKTQGAEVGVSGDLIDEGTSGLPVVIAGYANMQVGDVIKFYWDDELVATHRMRAGQERQPLTLNIPAQDIPTGTTECYYSVMRLGSGEEEQSTRISVLVRLNYPGEDETNEDELAAPHVAPETIGLDTTTVQVSIPAYAKMRRYDRIYLSWSGHVREHEVKRAEVGKTVVIEVPEDVVRASSEAEMSIAYRVVDEVGNESADWSVSTAIQNGLAKGLPAPFVVEPLTSDALSRLRSGEPGTTGLRVEIDPPQEGFPVGGNVHAQWTTRSALDEVSVIDLGSQAVIRARRTLVFDLPADYFMLLWGGSGTASYELSYDGQTQASKRTRVDFVGAPVKLPPPLLGGISEGHLEADLSPLTVSIPATAQLQANDTVTLTWHGTRPDGTLLLEKPGALHISSARAGQEVIFRLDADKLLVPLDGGALEITYTVMRGKVQLLSEPAFLDIGEALETLEPPSLDPAPAHSVLDPSLPTYLQGVDAIVPLSDELTPPYDVEIEWSLSDGTVYFDTQHVTEANVTQARFQIPRAQLESTPAQTLSGTLYYRIIRPDKPDLISYDLDLVLGRQPQLDLPSPVVSELDQDMLDPTGLIYGATVTIPALANLAAGDKVVLYWNGDQPNSVTEVQDSVAYGEEGQSRTLPIDLTHVLASENGEVDLQYEVIRFEHNRPSDWSELIRFTVQRGKALPLAVVAEVVEGNIDPLDIRDQITVVIGAAAKLVMGDEVVINLAGEAAGQVGTVTYQVKAEDAGRPLKIKVPSNVLNSHFDKGMAISYSIKRQHGGVVQHAAEQHYSVGHVISDAPLRVMGARHNVVGRSDITPPRLLTAVNASTSRPVMAEWRYRGDTHWTPSYSWRDIQPKRLLEVRTKATSIVLNILNVVGHNLGFCALLDTQTQGVYGLQNWGKLGAIPAGVDNVTDLSMTGASIAAKSVDGSIRCWGPAAEGGVMRPEDTQRRDFLSVHSNFKAFVALYGSSTGERHLTGWGDREGGARIPQDILDLRDVTNVIPSRFAFAALRHNGSVVAWGAASDGGVLPNACRAFDDVVDVQAGCCGFVARRITLDGRKKVFAWGDQLLERMPSSISERDDIESIEACGYRMCCLLTAQGQVLAFGNTNDGGVVPAEIARLTDIVEVTSTKHAFCARRKNGHIVAWGQKARGGELPADIARRADVVQVAATAGAFAALFADGSVRCWGEAGVGGNANAVAGKLYNVRAVYGASYAFCALTDDGRVLSWGFDSHGGNNLRQQSALVQKVRVQHT